MSTQDAIRVLQRIAQALEKLAPQSDPRIDIKNANAYVWDAHAKDVIPVQHVQNTPLNLLLNINEQRDTLLANTQQFVNGYPANNALLWGARGMGKSSLVKSIHAHINQEHPDSLVLVEIYRDDIASLPLLIRALSGWVIRKFLIYCDDLSFDETDSAYKSLKAVLEGGIEGCPDHILFYATSNRRHLLARNMTENEQSTAINPGDTAQEKISLSDRFGLWLGFHPCDQHAYLQMIDSYNAHYKITENSATLHEEAILWARTRGNMSGRVAWQFIQDFAGKKKRHLR